LQGLSSWISLHLADHFDEIVDAEFRDVEKRGVEFVLVLRQAAL
jgi:hypothetical protein